MILTRNITLQHKIDKFLARKFKEYPDIANIDIDPAVDSHQSFRSRH